MRLLAFVISIIFIFISEIFKILIPKKYRSNKPSRATDKDFPHPTSAPSKRKRRRGQTVHDTELEISYKAIDGTTTDRKIRVMSYHQPSRTIAAWCHTRNAQRTFRVDRIISAVDINTGEEISDMDDYLRDH
ncbi:WYL domain-containing protein [Salmonella enterica]|uniref:WYL domain-containing protein n=1 Tax=Salmonella enterica TaxID=28901 RepID=UPI0016002F4E|nr:WYL domain-containing protein [Salmonella enterica]